ncbi:hypothetical protein [Elstera litoralis]|uniref:hypothetical protein n=1 Tax=Elstera litoralis TaxID=552518 RepID=UPI001E59CB95|nr:hypothetical protein [Elstera litoralis]
MSSRAASQCGSGRFAALALAQQPQPVALGGFVAAEVLEVIGQEAMHDAVEKPPPGSRPVLK